MSEYRSSSHSFVPWEYRILIALLVILGSFYFTWEVILEEPAPTARPPVQLEAPSMLIPWQGNPPVFLMEAKAVKISNPFFTHFPIEAPIPQATQNPKDAEETPQQPPPQQPPPPPPRTISISFKGIRVALTGKTFVILDINDSKTGQEVIYKKEGDSFANDFTVKSISGNTLVLSGPDGNASIDLSYGDTKVFTLKENE